MVMLKKLRILVTGGSGDIGEAVVRQLAQEGHCVAIHYHTCDQRAKKLAQEVKGLAVGADISKKSQVQKMIKTVVKAFGSLDGLVNVAGFPINNQTRSYWDFPFEKVTPEMYQKVFEVDTLGTIHTIQSVLSLMKKKKYGKIINFASASALLGHHQGYPFNVAKAGVINLTKSLAKELGPYGVTVNAIAPCTIKTRWLNSYPKKFAKKLERSLKKKIPLGRLGTPQDIAKLVSFLLSPGGDWLTGQVYLVDGGETL